MNFDKYQKKAMRTAIYDRKYAIIYPALKLAGEAGEVAEKVGKLLRGDYVLNDEFKSMLAKELGDVQWYLAALARDINIPLDTIAKDNIKKLTSRKQRGTIKGSGDDR